MDAMVWPTGPYDSPRWRYNEEIVSPRGQDDLAVRLMVAEIVNLYALLGIIRDGHAVSQCLPARTTCDWVKRKMKEVSQKAEYLRYWS